MILSLVLLSKQKILYQHINVSILILCSDILLGTIYH